MTVFFLPVDAADIWPFLLNTADMADDKKIDHLAQNGRKLPPINLFFIPGLWMPCRAVSGCTAVG
jgi:hypothetical protein